MIGKYMDIEARVKVDRVLLGCWLFTADFKRPMPQHTHTNAFRRRRKGIQC
jgi:hypothetical protein